MDLPFPAPVGQFLERYHAGGVTDADCRACCSACCSLGGFAILENVVRIYERYRQNTLRRADYEFQPGLGFADFVFKHFDVYKKRVPLAGGEVTLMLFHMRSLSEDGHLISIPAGGDYWEIRAELFRQNPWLNRGCIFLSHKVGNWPENDRDASRHCILHTESSGSCITAKPVDCVFFTCNTPVEGRVPTEEQSLAWFRLLAEYFPGSLERFESMIQDEPNHQK